MKKSLILSICTLLMVSCSINAKENNKKSLNSISESNNQYTITFKNDEGSILSTKQYDFGVKPSEPSTPSKENPVKGYKYTFSGWSPSVSLVTSDATYVATYKVETDKSSYVIKWVDGDGKTLLEENYNYGAIPNYHGNIPTKKSTSTTSYVFNGWEQDIKPVDASKTYTAKFDSIPIPSPSQKYSIDINCTNCSINKHNVIHEEYSPNTSVSYQFENISDDSYHYPFDLDVKVNGVTSNDYNYDNVTGKLDIVLKGNTIINAVGDNSAINVKVQFNSQISHEFIFTYEGNLEHVDWGDGTSDSFSSHIFNDNNVHIIRIYGDIKKFNFNGNEGILNLNIYSNMIKEIGEDAFYNCTNLTTYNVPKFITKIADSAFKNCYNLESVVIPDSVISIGSKVFENCNRLKSITLPSLFNEPLDYYFNGRSSVPSSLKSVTLTSCTSIGDYAFKYCYSLTSITIPDSVTSIGDGAFSFCESLTSINIPNSVTSIGNDAFCGCESLTSIFIPNSVTSIGTGVFGLCNSLISIKVDSNNHTYDSRNNCNAIIETKSNKLITGCDSTIIPNSVTSIGSGAFRDCRQLTSINIPNSVTSIGSGAFYYCESLTSINIPNSVTSICNATFSECSSLTSITIPNSVTSIGDGVFSGCSSLTSITIPSSVTSIGRGVFEYCKSLISIKVDSNNHTYDSRNNCNAIIETKSNELINGCGSTIIPNSVTSIGDYAFKDCYFLTSINIPNSVTSIGSEAFWNCYSLTSINIPNSVTSIGSSAFSGCDSLTSITIPNGVKTIDYYAFKYCESLTSITLPNSLTYIGEGAFDSISILTADLRNVDHVISASPYGLFNEDDIYLKIIVKKELCSAYKNAPGWKKHMKQIIGE